MAKLVTNQYLFNNLTLTCKVSGKIFRNKNVFSNTHMVKVGSRRPLFLFCKSSKKL
jgi:hypothetical protein